MLVRMKSANGGWEQQVRDMSMDEIVEWMSANTKDGTVTSGIVLFHDALLKAAGKDNEFEWTMSNMDLDRDRQQVDPAGWDLKNFKDNPVLLWSHDWTRPAVGKVKNPHVERSEALRGIAVFDPPEVDAFAGMIAAKVRLGTLSKGSVGFRPIKVEIPGEEEGKAKKPDSPRMIFRKQELIEFSVCNIPSNPSASVTQSAEIPAGKGPVAWSAHGTGTKQAKEPQDTTPETVEEFEVETTEIKGVIPYADHGTEPEGTPWDAGKEVRDADTDTLKIICAWFDSSAPDVKSSYKLPHHRAGSKKAVWKGVAAAMGALLGARGGVDIPEGDRKGVYNHLSKHYKEFDKEPPEYKSALSVVAEELTRAIEGLAGRLSDLSDRIGVAEPPKERSLASAYFNTEKKVSGSARGLASLLPGSRKDREDNSGGNSK